MTDTATATYATSLTASLTAKHYQGAVVRVTGEPVGGDQYFRDGKQITRTEYLNCLHQGAKAVWVQMDWEYFYQPEYTEGMRKD